MLTDWVNLGLALGICASCTASAARMSRATRCAVRFGIFAIFVGALLAAAGGVWDFGEWVQTVLLGGVLIYLVANIRQPIAVSSPSWANALAWLITALVVVMVCRELAGG